MIAETMQRGRVYVWESFQKQNIHDWMTESQTKLCVISLAAFHRRWDFISCYSPKLAYTAVTTQVSSQFLEYSKHTSYDLNTRFALTGIPSTGKILPSFKALLKYYLIKESFPDHTLKKNTLTLLIPFTKVQFSSQHQSTDI